MFVSVLCWLIKRSLEMDVSCVEMAGVLAVAVTVIGSLKQVIIREIHVGIWS
jgi:hypothetical protein